MLALLVLALAASPAPAQPYPPASAEECKVIDAAVGSAPATTVAVPPEQIVPPGDARERDVFGAGAPPVARGQPAADISGCLRRNRPHDPIPGSNTTLIVSRATIDDATGRAAVLVNEPCEYGGVIRLVRDRDGEWIKSPFKPLWRDVCDIDAFNPRARR